LKSTLRISRTGRSPPKMKSELSTAGIDGDTQIDSASQPRVNSVLPVLTRGVRRTATATLTWLARVNCLLSSRKLIVLVAHYCDRDKPTALDTESIRTNLTYLRESCTVLPLHEALNRLARGKPLPRRAVSLVIDDAALPFYRVAWPLLKECDGLPFSLAVIPGLIRSDSSDHLISRVMYGMTSLRDRPSRKELLDRANSWLGIEDREEEPTLEALFLSLQRLSRDALGELVQYLDVPNEDFMTWEQLTELRSTGSVHLVSHSMSHPRFRYVEGDWLDWEVRRSKEILENQLGEDVQTFVFPYGSPKGVTTPVRESLKRNGYHFAFLTTPGLVTVDKDRFLLPRVDAEVPEAQFRRNTNTLRLSFSERRPAPTIPNPISASLGPLGP